MPPEPWSKSGLDRVTSNCFCSSLCGRITLAALGVTGLLCFGTTATAMTTITKGSGGMIKIYSLGTASSNSQSVVVTGAFADAGSLTVSGNNSTVILSRGTITINLAKGVAAENRIFNNLTRYVSPTNCGINASYTAPVKLIGGTGAYVGISGILRLTTTEIGVFPKSSNGQCNLSESAQPIGFLSLGVGSGLVHLKNT
jgi:hypothetical protein